MRIALNGASGYTGRLAAAELARRGIDAVLVGRDPGRLAVAAAGAASRSGSRTSATRTPWRLPSPGPTR